MKLAFVLFKYFPYGGLQRDFLRIAKECIKCGHSVHVYTMSWQGEKDPAMAIYEISAKGWQNHTKNRNFAKKIQPSLRYYDLVIGFNKMPGLDVYYAADTCFQAKVINKGSLLNRWLPRYQHMIHFEKSVFEQTSKTRILLISPAQQKEFQQFYATRDERFSHLPPGIAKDRIAPGNAQEIRVATRALLNIKEDEFLLLMIGSGFKTKGLDRTLIALAALPIELKSRTKLYVIGQDAAQSFKSMAKKLKIADKVYFLGGRKDIPDILLAGDVLLHPAYNENTGTVLLEALVSGLPVVASSVCGYAHYIEEAKAGRVMPEPFSQVQFNEVLRDVLRSMPCHEWRTNALVFAKSADIYSMPTRVVSIIESLGKHDLLS